MDPFAQASRALARSPLGIQAVYRVGGGDPLPGPVRIVLRPGENTFEQFGVTAQVAAMRFDICVGDLTPQAGDVVETASTRYVVRGDPVLNELAHVWTCETDGGSAL